MQKAVRGTSSCPTTAWRIQITTACPALHKSAPLAVVFPLHEESERAKACIRVPNISLDPPPSVTRDCVRIWYMCRKAPHANDRGTAGGGGGGDGGGVAGMSRESGTTQVNLRLGDIFAEVYSPMRTLRGLPTTPAAVARTIPTTSTRCSRREQGFGQRIHVVLAATLPQHDGRTPPTMPRRHVNRQPDDATDTPPQPRPCDDQDEERTDHASRTTTPHRAAPPRCYPARCHDGMPNPTHHDAIGLRHNTWPCDRDQCETPVATRYALAARKPHPLRRHSSTTGEPATMPRRRANHCPMALRRPPNRRRQHCHPDPAAPLPVFL
ncbi:hypothetical protein EDB84DRAFT_1446707 [Lactarius hengduanensis]|nr:hypothetical protein EDB84DRAFT_1446707 [Lactarius hengduanensis]